MKRLRILHCYQSPSFSGAEAYALEVANYHAKSHAVTFLAKKDSALAHRLDAARLEVATSPARLSFSDFDLVILHSTQEIKNLWPRLALTKLRSHVKVIVYTHIWISHSKRDPLHAVPYALVDELWTSSEASRKNLARMLPIAERKIRVVRYGRDIPIFLKSLSTREDARKKLAIPTDAILIGTIARLDEGKGSRELFEAVTDLMSTRIDVHLLMIGPPTDGDPKATELDFEIDRAIEKIAPAIRGRIHKFGRVEQASLLLPAFDLFVLASYRENFALTLIEAMCAGLPSVATESGGTPDLIRPHETGWLFQPGSTEALRSTLLQALDQKETWLKFGENAKKLAVARHDFAGVMRTTDQAIEALVVR